MILACKKITWSNKKRSGIWVDPPHIGKFHFWDIHPLGLPTHNVWVGICIFIWAKKRRQWCSVGAWERCSEAAAQEEAEKEEEKRKQKCNNFQKNNLVWKWLNKIGCFGGERVGVMKTKLLWSKRFFSLTIKALLASRAFTFTLNFLRFPATIHLHKEMCKFVETRLLCVQSKVLPS